VSYKKLIHL